MINIPIMRNFNIESSDEEPEIILPVNEEEVKETDNILDEEVPVPKFEQPAEIVIDDIFDKVVKPKAKKKEKKVIEEDLDEDTGESNPNFIYTEPPVKLTKAGKPRKKRVLSEEQKAKMKAGREATAARKRLEKQDDKKIKELVKQKKKKELERLEKEVNETEEEQEVKQQPIIAKSDITKEDLVKAQYAAIHTYDSMRKERKAEKKKKLKEEQLVREYQEQVKATMKKVNDWENIGVRWADCF